MSFNYIKMNKNGTRINPFKCHLFISALSVKSAFYFFFKYDTLFCPLLTDKGISKENNYSKSSKW